MKKSKNDIKKELLFLAHKVARRMRRNDTTGKTVTLKVKYNDFTLKTRSGQDSVADARCLTDQVSRDA